MTQVETSSPRSTTHETIADPLTDAGATPGVDQAVAAPRASRLPWRRGSGRPRSGGMFSALTERNFRIYAGGAAVSNVGTWMQRVAQDWLVLELSHGSGVAVGITTALQFLPMLLLSPYGGLMADRFDKRFILKLTQAWMALTAGLLGVLAITGHAETWHVYLIAFAFGLATAFDNPARQSFVSEIVGREKLTNAIALNSANFNAGRIIGPAVAGVVIAAFGSGWAILGNAVSYVAFILALVLIDAGRLHLVTPTKRAAHQLREGAAYVWGRKDILVVLFTVFFVGTFGMNFQMTSALMATQVFHKGAAEYGILGTFMAVGSLAGALLAARRTHPPRARFIVIMACVFAVVEMVVGMMPSYVSYAAALPIMGLVSLSTLTAANACVQMGVDPQFRGRVMAIYAMVMMGGTPVGAPLLGWVGQTFGARWTLIGGGGLTLLGVVVSVLLLARANGVVIRSALPHRTAD
ncbi:MFS family permease [Friedmanniella endophytica]|uniref:MFS family permease n=1 Tax=Microlunatus kandeliicorticis TaxID=1759536 RepID=A0A7W3ISZ6_9ACTN|nr:MFS transporter [Microlunatus kandeliicorticis]MBA8794676.1 MFS family permease [Microlunatus kandeliicorticis]